MESIFNKPLDEEVKDLNGNLTPKQLTSFVPLACTSLSSAVTSPAYSELANAHIIYCMLGTNDTSLTTCVVFVDKNCANCRGSMRIKPSEGNNYDASVDVNFLTTENKLQIRQGEKGELVNFYSIRKVFYT